MSTNEITGRRLIRSQEEINNAQEDVSIIPSYVTYDEEHYYEEYDSDEFNDDYEPTPRVIKAQCDEPIPLYGEFGEMSMVSSDIYQLKYELIAFERNLEIMEQCLRALKGDTCTAVIVHPGFFYPPTDSLSSAVAHKIDMEMKDYYIQRDMDEMEE